MPFDNKKEKMMFYFVATAGLLILALYAMGRAKYENRVKVDPGDRERVVIRDLGGKLRVLGVGEHYPLPWWEVFARVRVNREAVEIEDDQVKSHDNSELTVAYRYDMLAGRAYDENGQFVDHRDRIDDTSTVQDAQILSAVTRLDDYEKDHRPQILQRVKAEMEAIFAGYTDEDLFLLPQFNEAGDRVYPHIPKDDEQEWIREARDPQIVVDLEDPEDEELQYLFPNREEGVRTEDQLYQRLGYLIELRVNYRLRFLGINIVSFQLTKLLFRDSKKQSALEAKSQRKRLDEATEGLDLTDAQKFALNTDQLGSTSIARGIEKLGESLQNGISEGIRKAFGGDNNE